MRRHFCLLCSWFVLVVGARADGVELAAASDLVYCLEALNERFAADHPGIAVRVSTGSSGHFYAQIRHGAPFDLLMSADVHYPRELIRAGLAEATSLTPYATGRLVLWTLRRDLDLEAGLEVLRSPGVRRVALAQPDHAPYGRAAREALLQANLWVALESKLVTGDNVTQAAQFVQTRNADAGLVALSLVRAPRLRDTGRFVLVPAEAHAPLEQAAVLTRRGARNPAAQRYLQFLSSPSAREVFRAFGFEDPPSAGAR